MEKKVRLLFFAVLILLVSGFSFALADSNFPNRPIDLVVPYTPGGAFDIITGAFKERVGKILGQPVLANYKPGASGAIGSSFVANAKPDGYTLLAGGTSHNILLPLIKKDLGYTLDDFAPVCNLATIPNMLFVKDDSPYKTLHDFLQAGKTKKMRYATFGALSVAHIIIEDLCKKAGIQAIHIPYAGAPAAMAAVLGGHIDMVFLGGAPGGMVKPGMLRVLAVSSEKRVENYPDVPTFEELGYPVSLFSILFIAAPKGTPKEIISRIYDAHKKVVDESGKEIAKNLSIAEYGLNLLGPEDLLKAIREANDRFKKRIDELGLLTKEAK